MDVDGDHGRYYIWTINDRVVLEGIGKDQISYVMAEPGSYRLRLVDKVDGEQMVSAEASIRVVSELEETFQVGRGVTVEIPAANETYRQYEWHVDGNTVSNEAVLKYKFDTSKRYRVECKTTTNPPEQEAFDPGTPSTYAKALDPTLLT